MLIELCMMALSPQASERDLAQLKQGEPPYPGSSTEEFVQLPAQDLGPKVILETDSGEKEVHHPLARKGLVRIKKDGSYIFETDRKTPKTTETMKSRGVEEIDEDGTYHYETSRASDPPGDHRWTGKGLIKRKKGTYRYKVTESPREGTYSFRFGTSTAPQFSREVNGNTLTYDSIYGGKTMSYVSVAKDWSLNSARTLAIQLDGGIFFSPQKNGIFVERPTETSVEKYTLLILPLTVSLAYRGKFTDTQKIVPYLSAGGGLSGVLEIRDDQKRTRSLALPVVHGVAGIGFNMDLFDRDRMNTLDSTRGINDIFLTLEARVDQVLDSTNDFSTQSAAIGFIIDY